MRHVTINHTHWIASDGYTTNMRILEAQAPKGVVIVFHGMMEHGARYDEFAEFLYAHHFHTFIPDLRCFGERAQQQDALGHLEPNQGFEQLIQDAEELVQDIKQQYPELPVFAFGHSFGSLISRRLGQTLGHELAGVIASGPPTDAGVSGAVSKQLVKRLIANTSAKQPAEGMARAVFGRYNLRFFPALSSNAWLSSDPQSVLRYDEDPLSGQTVTLGFFHELLTATKSVNALANLYQHPRHLPLLLVAGEDDPVAFDGKGIHALFDAYNRVRVEDTQLTVYRGLRHELFHEFERIRVFADIAGWLNNHINAPYPASIRKQGS
ncbi:alpha/beta fold hydrolase [Exiguobacterium oxidotolerans]|uniref:alpha/beta fold hydrolase n=1 Tax=Exiguobacterium oxidotolerans TaxID=223958 RepID=UPI000494772F|nr:alpha/beta fold hydrolase [Exiguobacterium oxidotolerans]